MSNTFFLLADFAKKEKMEKFQMFDKKHGLTH